MVADLWDGLLAVLQVAWTDPGPDAPRGRRRFATLVLVAGVVVIALAMSAIAVAAYLLTN